LLVAGLHWAYLYANQISMAIGPMVLGYLLNYVMAVAIFISLVRLAGNKSQYLGFIFLFGSAFKFLLYFLIFEPLIKQDGDLTRVEFFFFFIPYLVSLTFETIALVKLLRTLS
jgi:predicted membrane-bound spermidine synthase